MMRKILRAIEGKGVLGAGSALKLFHNSYATSITSGPEIHGGTFAQLLRRNKDITNNSRAFSASSVYNTFPGGRQMPREPTGARSKDKAVVHVLLKGNKCSVTMTDTKGNKITGASTGSLEERKGRGRASSLAAEATAEQVGRTARRMGIKSVVMKVKGSTIFRKKKKVILSFREGYVGDDIGVRTPIVQIHDVTQLPHNGCRLPKQRRV